MESLENEIRRYFRQHEIPYDDNTRSFKKLDFGFGDPDARRHFAFDVKEKRQHYSLRNWPAVEMEEEHLFILDDLAARKVLAFAPNAGLVVRDNVRRKYFFFSVVDLYLMPKMRVNRKIRRTVEGLKGKWLIDLRNGLEVPDVAGVFRAIKSFLESRKRIFFEQHACYGEYVGEKVGEGGVLRIPQHWDTDVSGTR